MAVTQRSMRPMSREQALGRLGSVPYGRVVFTQHALPAVRLVNHLIDRGQIIIRIHEGAAIAGATGSGPGNVVAYEADQTDPTARTAWSIVVTGVARLVDDAQQAARYRQTLEPWAGGDVNDVIIRIDPQIVCGYQHAGTSAAVTRLTGPRARAARRPYARRNPSAGITPRARIRPSAAAHPRLVTSAPSLAGRPGGGGSPSAAPPEGRTR